VTHSHNVSIERTCGDCTSCCEGWLYGEAYGHQFNPGQPCFYLCKSGCSIYEKRPEDPCRLFKCVWLEEADVFPEWMKPSESNIICIEREWVNEKKETTAYLAFTATGKEIDTKAYHWIMKFHYENKIPITVQLHDDIGIYGPDEFIDYIRNT
jgi:hypothetical protein